MVEQVQASVVRTGGTPVREVDYSYDALNRLTSETVVGATSTTYTYDDVGNRLAKDVCSGDPLVCETTTYAYNANNQLVSEDGPDGVTSYFYDSNGNLVEKSVGAGLAPPAITTYAYDPRNRMIGAETPDDDLGFVYDADGIRVAKTVNGDVTNFLIDKVQPYAQVVEERNGSGALVASYTYGNDLVSQTRGASTAYYAYDGLGSTRALTDAAGAVTDSYTYDAFGKTVSEAGATENAYRFTGEQFEAGLQLYYLRARYYDPAVGRFGVMDTWGGNAKLPLTLNRYLYADGNPVIFVDPRGRSLIVPLMVSIAVAGALTLVAHPVYEGGGLLSGAYTVDGFMQFVHQNTDYGCWAASATMMMSWMYNKQYGEMDTSGFLYEGLAGYVGGTPEAEALKELEDWEYWLQLLWGQNTEVPDGYLPDDWADDFWLQIGLAQSLNTDRSSSAFVNLLVCSDAPIVIEIPTETVGMGHYMVVKGVNREKATVYDPWSGGPDEEYSMSKVKQASTIWYMP